MIHFTSILLSVSVFLSAITVGFAAPLASDLVSRDDMCGRLACGGWHQPPNYNSDDPDYDSVNQDDINLKQAMAEGMGGYDYSQNFHAAVLGDLIKRGITSIARDDKKSLSANLKESLQGMWNGVKKIIRKPRSGGGSYKQLSDPNATQPKSTQPKSTQPKSTQPSQRAAVSYMVPYPGGII